MTKLDSFDLELHREAYAGHRWMYVPRAEQWRFGLAIVIVGHHGKIDIPIEMCSSLSMTEMTSYADELNAQLEEHFDNETA